MGDLDRKSRDIIRLTKVDFRVEELAWDLKELFHSSPGVSLVSRYLYTFTLSLIHFPRFEKSHVDTKAR